MSLSVGSLVATLGLDASPFSRELESARRQAQRFGKTAAANMGDAEKQMRFAEARAEALGRTLAAAGVIGLAGIAKIVSAAADFEAQFVAVAKTVDATTGQLSQLKEELIEMSTSAVPMSARGLAEIAAAAGQLGLKVNDIGEFTKVIADLSSATNLQGEEAAKTIARLGTITQLGADKFDNLGSALVDLGNNLPTTERDIANLSLRMAGAGAAVGLTADDVVGLAAGLSAVGIEAEAGGSSASRVLREMANAARSGGAEMELFAEVSRKSSDQFAADFAADAAGSVVAFVEGLAALNEEGKNIFPVLKELSLNDIRISDSLLRAASNAEGFAGALDRSRSAFADNNALTEEANKAYDTTSARMEMAKNSAAALAIDLGENLLPAVDAMAGGVQTVSEFVGGMSEEAQTATGVFIAMASGMGVASVVIARLTPTLRLLAGNLSATARTAGVAKVALTALSKVGMVALLAALSVVISKLMKARDEAREMASAIGLDKEPLDRFKALNAELEILEHRWNNLRADEKVHLLGDNAQLRAELNAVNEEIEKIQKSTLQAAGVGQVFFDSYGDAVKYFKEVGLAGQTLNEAVALTTGTTETAKFVIKEYGEGAGELSTELEAAAAAHGAYQIAIGEVEAAASDAEVELHNYGKAVEVIDKATEEDFLLELNDPEDFGELTDAIMGLVDPIGAYQDALVAAGEKGETSLAKVTEKLKEQTAAQQELLANLASVASRVPETFIPALRQMAIESPDLIAEMKDASDEELEAFVQANVDASEEVASEVDRALGLLPQIAETHGRDVADAMSAELLTGSSTAEEIMTDYRRSLAHGVNPLLFALGRKGVPLVSGYADGGVEDHTAQIAKAGEWRVWAEPETGGEAYIPLSPAKRSRSVDIWRETGRLLGVGAGHRDGTPEFFAGGGFSGVGDVPPSPGAAPYRWAIGTPANASMEHMFKAVVEELPKLLVPQIGAGVERMMGWLRSTFPGLPLYSGARGAGSTTATGGQSYHGQYATDGTLGRAVDIPPRLDVNRHIADNVPHSRELILSLPGSVNIKNGRRRGFFGEPTFSDHLDHNHWALADGGILGGLRRQRYDVGGLLPVGATLAVNNTGSPEIVLPHQSVQELVDELREVADLLRDAERRKERADERVVEAEHDVAKAHQSGDQSEVERANERLAEALEEQANAAIDIANLTVHLDNVDAHAEAILQDMAAALGVVRQEGESLEEFLGRLDNAVDDAFEDLNFAEQLDVLRALLETLPYMSDEWVKVSEMIADIQEDIQDAHEEAAEAMREAAEAAAQAAQDALDATADAASRAADDAARERDRRLAELNRLLDAEQRVRDQIEQANARADQATVEAAKQLNARLAEINESAAERRVQLEESAEKKRANLVAERTAQLARAFDGSLDDVGDSTAMSLDSMATAVQRALDIGFSSESFAFEVEQNEGTDAEQIIKNLRDGTGKMLGAAMGLDELRSRGLSADVIAFLGLDDGTEQAANDIKRILGMSDGQLADLGDAVSERLATAASMAAAEAGQLIGPLGAQLAILAEQTEGQLADLADQTATSIADTYAAHEVALTAITDDLQSQVASLNDQLMELGRDLERSAGEAIAAGLDSSNPAIVAAAEALAASVGAAMAAEIEAALAAAAAAAGAAAPPPSGGGAPHHGRPTTGAAAAAAGVPGATAPPPNHHGRPTAGAGGVGQPAQSISMNGTGVTSAHLNAQKALGALYGLYDSGGWLMPGLTLAENRTGVPERILGPNEQRGGHTVNISVDARGAAPGVGAEVRVALSRAADELVDGLSAAMGGR